MGDMADWVTENGEIDDLQEHHGDCYCRMCRADRVRYLRYKERNTIVSRTDDMRQSGGRERAGSGGSTGAPFVKWRDDYAWFEGEVTGTFNTKYGLAATIAVHDVCSGGIDTQGKDEDGNNFQGNVVPDKEVSLGTGYATMEDKITAEDVGKRFHVAFEGWEQPKGGGSRYRIFAVIELEERKVSPQRSAEGIESYHPEDVGSTTGEAGPGHPDNAGTFDPDGPPF